MNKLSLAVVCLSVALFAGSAFAAGDATTTVRGDKAAAAPQFDHRIDTWVEGVIITLDADGSKFAVRGVKLPYATAHAAMQADLVAKTEGLAGEERAKKEQEVRQS